MKLPNDAPIIAVPMCVKPIDGQNYHTVGEKYLTGLIDGAGAYPLSFPAALSRWSLNKCAAWLRREARVWE